MAAQCRTSEPAPRLLIETAQPIAWSVTASTENGAIIRKALPSAAPRSAAGRVRALLEERTYLMDYAVYVLDQEARYCQQ